MGKVKCSKCGYLNPSDELVCGMCGEVFKKEKSRLDGKKVLEDVPLAVVEEEAVLAKPARTAKKKKAATKLKVEKKPKRGTVPETIKIPEPKTRKKPPVPEDFIESIEELTEVRPSAPDTTSSLKNFLQTEDFRQAVMLAVREAIPARTAAPPSMDPDELKSIVESKINQALPAFLQSDAVIKVVREAAGSISLPEGEAPAAPAISDEDLERKVGDILAKSAGRKDGPSLTMEAVELKINAMLADIREKMALLSDEEPPLTPADVKKIVENQIAMAPGVADKGQDGLTEEKVAALIEEKLAQAPAATAPGELEEKIMADVKRFLEEQGTRELPQAPLDEEKIASLVESKVAQMQPSAEGAAADPAAIKQQVEDTLNKKIGGTEFAIMLMEIARDVISHSPVIAKDSQAPANDEAITARVNELLPGILKSEDFQNQISAAIEEVSSMPQISARDVERIVNTRIGTLASDVVESDSFKKKVSEAVKTAASGAAEAITPEEIEEKLSSALDSLRGEMESLFSSSLEKEFDSEAFAGKVRTLAAEEAAKVSPETPSLDLSELDEKLAQLRGDIEEKTAGSLELLEDRVAATPGLIDEKVSAYWQEKLSSDEIVAKISEVARQIAEGTIEARPALTQEDISEAWDEKFNSEETLGVIQKLARQTAESVAEAQPSVAPAEIDEKLAQLREDIEEKTAGSLELLEDRVAATPELIDEKVSAYWQEKLSSDEIVAKISEVARQIAEGTIEARPALTQEDISEAWDEKFNSVKALAQIQEIAREVLENGLEESPSLSPDEVESRITEALGSSLQDLLSSEELAHRIEELAGITAQKQEESSQPQFLERVSALISSSIRAAISENLDSEEFTRVVKNLAEESAVETLTTQPRLTPDDVREIAGGQFDHWIETYFKSQDFRDKVTEHIRAVAMEMLRDARSVILEDAEMRTDEQLKELEERLAAALDEKVIVKTEEFGVKITEAISESDEKLRDVAMAFEQDLRPFKEKIDKLDEIEKRLPSLEKELAAFVKNAASSAVASQQKLKSLADQLASNIENVEKKIGDLSSSLEEAPSGDQVDEMISEHVEALKGKIEDMASKMSSITPTDPNSIAQMISAKVGDLPRRAGCSGFQKRLASLAEESMTRGSGGGLAPDAVASMIEEKLSAAGTGLGQDEMATLVVSQIDMYMANMYTSEEFKKAVHDNVTVSVEGGIDKDQFEQALRAFVQLEIRRLSESIKGTVNNLLDSDAFTEKVRTLAPAGAAGTGAPAAIDSSAILEHVKKALDTKEANLKIAKKFLEVMTFVKSEVPKLVQAALKKQG